MKVTTKPIPRNKELGWIHAGKKLLGLDEDGYRAMLEKVTGKRSAAELTGAERGKVLAYIDQHKPKVEKPARRYQNAPALDKKALWKKIDALLFAQGRTRSYLDGNIKTKIAKVDAWEFADVEALKKVIAALSIDANRNAKKATQNE